MILKTLSRYGLFAISIFLMLNSFSLKAQDVSWKFAHVTDTHIGNPTSEIDLQRTVLDINNNNDISFVILSGDITEFGTDNEFLTAKKILDNLNKPWYVIPGNHDTKWSESGGNSFKKVFGSETFKFESHGFLFLGTNCGPNMRMSPGQIPRENIVWLDSVLKKTNKETPIIFVNHYPLNSGLNNWYEAVDRLKAYNFQLALNGHGHNNGKFDIEGVPGIMGRSNLRAKDSIGGYNLVTIKGDSVFYNERIPNAITKPSWAKIRLYRHNFANDTNTYKRPNYGVNEKHPQIKEKWSLKDEWDIGAGMAVVDNKIIFGNTGGWVKAYRTKNGKIAWATQLGGKIYSTPSVAGKYVVVACTDGFIYNLNNQSGEIVWKAKVGSTIVASTVINDGNVFSASSDGHFKCFELESGNLKWDFTEVEGFVETRPLIYNGKIYFGSWGNKLYALKQKTGEKAWIWDDGYNNRMYSPAACVPVATKDRLFIVAPDRSMTCFNASTGAVIWRKIDPKIRVRESLGLSQDSTLVFVKTMDGDILGVDSEANEMQVNWKSSVNMGYDISPTSVQEYNNLVFGLSDAGKIYAFNRKDGSLSWGRKIANSLINPLSFLKGNKLIATTMDGSIICLKW